ncbi:MAG: hypothetical protein U0I39_06625 [Clostridia bacterium]|jgi:hypothetical protein|nr:hypothetical protein [Clostridia bacterium]DAQ69741.1 MAG TPA: Head Tail Connector Protein [Caudoviricetes sp.]
MLTYLKDEDEFKKQLGTEDVPKDFKNLNIQASSYINYKTFGRIDKDDIPEQVKYATCLIIDLINEENDKLSKIGNLKSQNIEGWSESYSTPEEVKSDYEDKKYSTLKQYLWNVIGTDGNPLLYCGMGC